jgi:TfoX/Sxy family transcriptional regulator of competence genes
MATTLEFVEYVCNQLAGIGTVRFKKMFGEYMVYVNEKPIVLVCDNIVYVKILDCIKPMMEDAEIGVPYPGSKEHYILDIDHGTFSKTIVHTIEINTQ